MVPAPTPRDVAAAAGVLGSARIGDECGNEWGMFGSEAARAVPTVIAAIIGRAYGKTTVQRRPLLSSAGPAQAGSVGEVVWAMKGFWGSTPDSSIQTPDRQKSWA